MESTIDVKVKDENEFNYETETVFKLNFDYHVKIENCSQHDENNEDNYNRMLLKRFRENFCTMIDKEELERTCLYCCQLFADRIALLKHNLDHLQVTLIKLKGYQCSECSSWFKQKSKLREHILLTHHIQKQTYQVGKVYKSKSNIKCDVCLKVFKYKYWHEHIRTVHSKERVRCDLCGKYFKCDRTYKRHKMYIHDGVRASWRSRSKSTSVEDQVQCSECKNMYRNKTALHTHMKNCHSEKPFQCFICKSVLKSKSYLVTHMNRVHYFDGMDHKCETCGKTFRSPRYLHIHMKNAHMRNNMKQEL